MLSPEADAGVCHSAQTLSSRKARSQAVKEHIGLMMHQQNVSRLGEHLSLYLFISVDNDEY